MGNWGSEVFTANVPKTPLDYAVFDLPKKLKQAMYAAASKNVIKKGTWNGCAMNQAGAEIGQDIKSVHSTALAFGCPDTLISNFIKVWDGLKKENAEATHLLLNSLERANLFAEPNEKPPRIYSVLVYENEQKALRRAFDEMMEANQIPDVEVALEMLQLV